MFDDPIWRWLAPALIVFGVLLYILAPLIASWMTYRMGW